MSSWASFPPGLSSGVALGSDDADDELIAEGFHCKPPLVDQPLGTSAGGFHILGAEGTVGSVA